MRAVRFVVGLSVLSLLATTAGSCGSAPNPPTNPSPIQPPAPDVAFNPGFALLTGTVVANTAQGRTVVAGATVQVTDLVDGPYGWIPWFELKTDANGRFSTNGMVRGRAVKIVARAEASSGLSQVCGINPTLAESTDVEVELVSADARPSLRSPTLSGVLFEDTPQGPTPAANVRVQYSSFGHDGADAYTRTDADGRYAFCNLPMTPGVLYADCVGPTSPSRFVQMSTSISGDTVLDVDVSRGRASCK